MSNGVSAPVVGIDLGTTFSCVAHYNYGRAEVIADRNGDRIIPSFVYYDPESGEVYVGKLAYDLATNCPSNGIRDIKRVIGRRYDDEFLTKYRNLQETPFSIVKGKNDLAAYEIRINEKIVIKTPIEVSSAILLYLKDAASAYLGQKITEAVVSIPAYFSNSQRKATKKAAELAGLKILKLVTEPVAGAIHYSKTRNMNSNVVVVDWGGGTLDVSFIEMKNETFKVKAVTGDTLLGGRNIDEILFKHFHVPVQRFPVLFTQRLLKECIVIKERLSGINKITKIMDCIDGYNNLSLSLTREKFEELIQPVFEKVMNIIKLGLYEVKLDVSDIDEVLLIGGSTRILKLSRLLETFFGMNKLRTDNNPDEAVACGACIQASLLKNDHPELKKYRITEVTPLSLGVLVDDGLLSKLIEKNSSLPITTERFYITSDNNAEFEDVIVFEGERKNCKYNNKLGSFLIKNLSLRRAGDVRISVKFHLDEDGILTVTAKEVNSNNSNSLEVAMGEFWLTGRNVQASIEEALKHKEEDRTFEKFKLCKTDIRRKCLHVLYDLKKISSEYERKLVETKCQEFLENINKINYTDIEELNDSFSVLYDSICHVITKYRYFSFFTK